MSPEPDRSKTAASTKAADVQLLAYERLGDSHPAAVTEGQIADIAYRRAQRKRGSIRTEVAGRPDRDG